MSLFALIVNLIPFQALPAHAAEIDLGTPAENAHHRPRPVMVSNPEAITTVGQNSDAIVPDWFKPPLISEIDYSHTAGLTLAAPSALAELPPAAADVPATTVLPNWFESVEEPQPEARPVPDSARQNSVLPGWFNPAKPALEPDSRATTNESMAGPVLPAWFAANPLAPTNNQPEAKILPDWFAAGVGSASAPAALKIDDRTADSAAVLPGWFAGSDPKDGGDERAVPAPGDSSPILPGWFNLPPGVPIQPFGQPQAESRFPIPLLTVTPIPPSNVSAGDEAVGGSNYSIVIRNNNGTLTALDFSVETSILRDIGGGNLVPGVGFYYVSDSVSMVSSNSGPVPVNAVYVDSQKTVTFTPVTTFNLSPGEAVTITFKWETDGTAVSGQRFDANALYQNPSGTDAQTNGGANVTVGRGNLLVSKRRVSPASPKVTFGDEVVFDVELNNTGQGQVFSASLDDIIGGGYTNVQNNLPATPIPVLAVSEIRNFLVTGTVNACNDLANTAQAYWSIGNQEGDGTVTNPVASTVNVPYELIPPEISVANNNVAFGYCAQTTQTAVVTLTNAPNAGAARNFRLISNQDFDALGLDVVGVSPGWTYFPVTDTFVAPFPQGLLGGQTTVFTVALRPQSTVCGTQPDGSFTLDTRYTDACGFKKNGPDATIQYQFDRQNTPSLSVTKNGTLAPNNRDASFTVNLNIQNAEALTGDIVITDEVSIAFSIVTTSATAFAGATLQQNGTQLIWTIPSAGLSGSQSGQLNISAQVITTFLEVCNILYNNTVTATARPDCPDCVALPPSFDSVDLSPEIRLPQLLADINSLQFDYCAATPQPVVITVTNVATAGAAYVPIVQMSSPNLINSPAPTTQPYPDSVSDPPYVDQPEVITPSVSPGWTYFAGTDLFRYNSTIQPGETVTLSFLLDPVQVCGNYYEFTLPFQLFSQDACGQSATPILLETTPISYDETTLPRLGIEKTTANANPAPGDVFSFTVNFTARNAQNMSDTLRITDTLPPAFVVVSATGVVTAVSSVTNDILYAFTGTNVTPAGVVTSRIITAPDGANTRLLWQVPVTDSSFISPTTPFTLQGQLIYYVRVLSNLADVCGASTTYLNAAQGGVGDRCPTCGPISGLSSQVSVEVQPSKIDAVPQPKTITANSDVCGQLNVTNVYSQVYVTDWTQAFFTETMGLIDGLSAGDLSYVPGTLTVLINGVDRTLSTTIVQTSPQLRLEFDNLAGTLATQQPYTFEISYTLYVSESLLAGAAERTINTTSQFRVNNIQNEGICGGGDDYVFEQAASTTIRRADLQIDITPKNFLSCASTPVTITVSDPNLVAYSLDASNVVVTFNVNGPDFGSIITDFTYGGFFGGNPVTVTVGSDTITWTFQNAITNTAFTTGTIVFTMARGCSGSSLFAGVQFDSTCGLTHNATDANTTPVPAPEVTLFATPDGFETLTERQVSWSIYAINEGDVVAGRTIISNVMGVGLQFVSYTTSLSNQVNLLTPGPYTPGQTIVWEVLNLQPQQQALIDVAAVDAVQCVGLTTTIYLDPTCNNDTSCGALQSHSISFVRKAINIRTQNNQTADVGLCDTGTVTFSLKNASNEVHIYNLVLSQTLTTLSYVAGSARFTVTDRFGNPIAGLANLPLEPQIITGTTITGTALMTVVWQISGSTNITIARLLFDDLGPEETINVTFDIQTDCASPDDNLVEAFAGGQEPCGAFFFREEEAVTLNVVEPVISMTKLGRNVTQNTPFSSTVFGQPGDEIVWQITISNAAGAFLAQNLVVEDTLPPNMDVATPTASSADGVITATPGLVIWNLGDLPADDVDRVLLITATVNLTDPDACLLTTTNQSIATYGCDNGCNARAITATAELRSRPQLQLQLPVLTELNLCGDPITITLINRTIPVYSLTLTDTLPAGFVFDGLITVTHNLTSGDYSPTGVFTTNNGHTAIFTWTQLPVGVFTLTFRTAQSVTSGTCAINLGTINQVDILYNDHPVCTPTSALTNSAVGSVSALAPSVQVSKRPLDQNVNRGDTISWTIYVTNTGQGEARNLIVTDTLGPGFFNIDPGPGSFGETPVIAGQQVTWALNQPLQTGQVWQAILSATVPVTGGTLDDDVQVRGTCDQGCEHTFISTTAYASLVAEFIKGPQIQTGTIGDLAVFTFTGFIDGRDFDYRNLTLTDTLPVGLGYLASTLALTTDVDGNSGGPFVTSLVAPSTQPAVGDSGPLIWQIGSVSGTVAFAGVITTVIQDIPANIDGVRRTNQITMTYQEADQDFLFVFTDTADVDIVEPLLHIGKSYVTAAGCEAEILNDNFNDGSLSGWQNDTTGGGTIQVSNGTLQLLESGDAINNQNVSDFSWSFMARKSAGNSRTLGAVFRGRNANLRMYTFEWRSNDLSLNRYTGSVNSRTALQGNSVQNIVLSTGEWHHFEIRGHEYQFQVYVDGELVLDAFDSLQLYQAGPIELRIVGSGTSADRMDIDDVLITRYGSTGCLVGAGSPQNLVTYTLTISNQGGAAGHDLVITDDIPAGMQLVNYNVISNGGSASITGPAAGARDVLTWTTSYLTPTVPFDPRNHTFINIELVLRVDNTISANTILENQASLVYDGQPNNGPVGVQRAYSGGSHSTAVRTVDATIAKTRIFAPPPTATLGTLVTYTIIVPSQPISTALYNVVVTDQLNTPLFYIENITTGGTFTNDVAGFNRATGLITATFEAIPFNSQAYITVTARISHEFPSPAGDPNSGDVITNAAVFTHATADSSTLTRSNVVTTEIGEPRVSVTKVAASSTGSLTNLDGNAIVTYTLRLENNGNSPAYSIHVTDTIPAGISVTQVLPGDYLAASSPVLGPDVLTWTVRTISNVVPANVVTLTYVAVITGALSNSELTNTVNVLYHSLTETIPGVRPYVTNTNEVITTAAPSLLKSTDPITLKVGDVVTYSLVFSVPAALVGMGGSSYLVDRLPEGLRFVPGSATLAHTPAAVSVVTTAQQSALVGSRQNITWTFGNSITSLQNLPTIITVTFQAQAVGEPGGVWLPNQTAVYNITNVATLTQRTEFIDRDEADNRVIQPELAIFKDSIPASGERVLGGQLITYTLLITNNGYAPAYDFIVTDTLPVGIDYLRTISNPAAGVTITTTRNGQALTYTVSELAAGPGATMVITIVAQVTNTITANVVLTNISRIPYYDSQPGPGPQTGLTPTQRVYTNGESSVYHITTQASIVKSVQPPTATLGSVITYVLLVPQPAITATLYDVRVSDQLDARLDLQQVITDGAASQVSVVGNSFVVTYLNSIPPLQQRRITVTAILSNALGAVAGEVITNQATLQHSTAVTVSNQPLFTVTEPDVVITKTGVALTSDPQTALYTVTVANHGNSRAYDLNIVDTLPDGITATNISNGGALINNGRAISWTISFLGVNQSVDLTYNGVLTEPIYPNNRFTNTAVVTNTSLTQTVPGVRPYTDTDQNVLRWPLGRVGDFVWLDVDYDGQQGTSGAEQPISDVVVLLYNTVAGTLIATTTTDAAGFYIFEHLPLNVSYTVQLAPENFTTGVLSPYLQTRLRASGVPTDLNSKASITATYLGSGFAVTTTLTSAFTEDLTLDYGFVPRMSLGNQVWFDTDNSGTLNVGEPSISDVVVVLVQNVNGTFIPISTTTTNAGGFYTFTNLTPGEYQVVITSSNFAPGGALEGFITSSTAIPADRLLSSDETNHGFSNGTLGSGGFVASTVITLTAGLEPQDNGNANYTIDFSFVRYDFGDLPDSGVTPSGYATHTYPTRLVDDGARHVILPNNNPTLGSRVDAEVDGQPNTPAAGDDLVTSTVGIGAVPGDDEDGVTFSGPLIPGETLLITVTTLAAGSGGADGRLTAWIDFDGDGQLEAGERITVGQLIAAGGSLLLSVTVPLTTQPGITTYARFRFSGAGQTITQPTGLALAGEVEDYAIPTLPLDWGDLPNDGSTPTGYALQTYPTQYADDGPRHAILPQNNPTLGSRVDAETNGQPSLNANEDDNVTSSIGAGIGLPGDDEDGVIFSGPLVPGENLVITVTASALVDGYLNAWLDFNGDGDLNDAGEQIALNRLITAGTFITLTQLVPVTAAQGITTYARFRFSSQQNLRPTGFASDGEVEDYPLPSLPLDYGDLPDTSTGNSYPTRNVDNGARHIIVDGNNPTLGTIVDAETDGQPSVGADEDDTVTSTLTFGGGGPGDDEDGIIFDTPLIPGLPATLTVSTLGAANGGADGSLNAWIDFNGNGTLDANERIVTNTLIGAGSSVQISFIVPTNTVTGNLYSRFRFSSDTANSSSPTGLANNGEVEDYLVQVQEVDLGDLPESRGYPTTFASNGAAHIIDGTFLGAGVDAELDGQPTDEANGDDTTGRDDEDGIQFLTPFVSGGVAQIRVTAGTTGYLNSWFDFDGDGTLDVYTITNISGVGAVISPSNSDIFLGAVGDYTITLQVPAVSISRSLYSRFRYTTNPGEANQPTGLANSGEVEDYVLMSLGDLVWRDDGSGGGTPDDGIWQTTEPVLPNVVLVLLDSSGITVTDGAGNPVTTTTDSSGRYLFTGLTPGSYRVRLPASNFQTGGPLESLLSSSDVNGTPSNPNNDRNEDRDENGVDDANPAANGISSLNITLVLGTEPLTDTPDGSPGDANSNLTLDFGFVPYDFGDLPEGPYSTTLATNGPRHVIRAINNPTLGSLIDAETDGQPSVGANGDDATNLDDEDGVSWTPLTLGQVATFTIVTTGSAGFLNGWIDWNGDGDFADAGEQVFTAQNLGTGTSLLNVSVPATATITGSIYMRFRYSTSDTLTVTGFAPDGEVEDYVTRIVAYDLGDLPDGYGTTLANSGPRHQISPTLFLGSRVDVEDDGQPSIGANGDDSNATSSAGAGPGDDEDGVSWTDLTPGQVATFTITASSSAGFVNGWIDFNGNGAFDSGEQVFTGQPLAAGVNTLNVSVPATTTITGSIYMRFRYSSQSSLGPTGDAPDGEVEDYVTLATRYDLGDLPDSFGTTYATNGPAHRILPVNNPTLGSLIDAERDGQPSVGANGDDNNFLDDEDGVQFSTTTLVPGQTLVITVSAAISGADGYLNGWIDFNGDGVLDNSDQIATSQFITAGETITLSITVPTSTQVISAYARFRFSSQPVLTSGGIASDGEVEDYVLAVNPLDFGDLPDSSTGNSYPTRLVDDGARHVIVRGSNPTLGDRVDAETNGQPNTPATGDDAATSSILVYGTPGADDEDGIIFDTPLIPGLPATLTVSTLGAASGGADGSLNAWIDFNGNGTLDANERIVTNTLIGAGSSVQISFIVPTNTVTGNLYSRFRFSSDTANSSSPTGLANNGEVEDYLVQVQEVDLGDLPESRGYPTTFASNGAAHIIDGTFLGVGVDAELDGQPTDEANGDDTTGRDDEDGIQFLTPFVSGGVAQIRVTAGTTGYLNSWFDFDGDGTLDVYTITNISGVGAVISPSNSDIFLGAVGDYTITLQVPPNVTISRSLYSRFRYTTNPGEANQPTGLANSGEVEDYVLMSLGDLVWFDNGSGTAFNNGRYEPGAGEIGAGGVVLVLLDSSGITVTDGAGNPVTTTTDSSGRYLFTGLTPGNYGVRVAASNFQAGGPLEGLLSSTGAGTPNSDLDEEFDENGIDNATPDANGIQSANITLSLGNEPDAKDGDRNSNPTLDFGFVPLLSLGNFVWFDSDNSGAWNAGEPGIPGVDVELYQDSNSDGVYTPGVDQFISTTTTLPGGVYTFTNLPPGGYVVVITRTNFTGVGALVDYLTSTTAVSGNSDLNNTNHGYLTGTLGNGGFVAGTVITLTPGLEPNDAGRANFTIDFGFIRADFGDLPDAYGTTLAANGPYHVILPSGNPTLGADVDAEPNGQPTADASGDDVTNRDDEDGVRLDTPLVSGAVATFTITAANVTGAALNAWIDWNGDGDFNDTGERVFTNTSLVVGPNELAVTIPNIVLSNTINTRWRYSTDTTGSSSPTGRAANGEIEDHQYAPTVYDFGDLPDNYGTTLATNGPRHVILPTNNPTLGADVDDEIDGLPTGDATGDDTNNRDDEDGVRLDSLLVPGEVATFTITATNVSGAALNGWIDWNGNGVFDTGERVFTNYTGLISGANVVTVVVPNIPLSDTINTRWRYSTDTTGSSSPTGAATNGEVEDHQFTATPLDLGDLPEGAYPTTLANNGARHAIISGTNPTLGRGVDAETNGQPSANANGDDLNPTTWYGASPAGTDDEDGVIWSPLLPGRPASVTVTALPVSDGGANGILNAWIDFNGNGVLDDAGEQIATNVTILAGNSITVTFTVPATASGSLYSRFRFSSAGGDSPTGFAADGEVEDYVRPAVTLDFGDLPDSYGTLFTSNGPRHIIDGTFLGSIVDAEGEGFPSNGATGDDTDNLDDEDGVEFLTPIVPGQPAQIRVTAGTTGYLNAWFDFDGNGTLDTFNITDINGTAVVSTSNSDIFFNATGPYTLTFTVPNVTISSSLYSRFRYTTNPGEANTPNGLANSGEVEDYVLLSLGNLVWRDDGSGGGGRNNGIFDGSEQGIPGVVLVLRNSSGVTVTDAAGNPVTTTTDANGRYLFPGLPPGDYTVFVPPSQFGPGGPLENHLSSSPNVANPNNDLDEDQDENGLNNNNPAANGVTSGIITLTPGGEPSGGGNSNLTLDFGFLALQPAIAVDKAVATSPNVISATVTYTVRVTNTGEITYTSLRLTDTLPTGFNYVNGSASTLPGSVNPGPPPVIVWDIPGPVYPNDVVTVTFEANIQTGITGTFVNNITGTGIFTGGRVTGDDNVPVIVTDPALRVVKSVVSTETGIITFSIQVFNIGPSRMDTVPLFDQFTGPVEFLSSIPPAAAFTNPTAITPGLIIWPDLTALNTPPYNQPHNLEPLEFFEVTTVFSITTRDAIFAMVNTATVSGAIDRYRNNAGDSADVETVVGPTAVDLLYFEGVEQPDGVLIRWATAAEINNFGFRLLRSKTGQLADAVEVTFVPAEGKNGSGAAYEYLDEDVTAGETYTYWLIDVDTEGTEIRHGPVSVMWDGEINASNSIIYLPLIVKDK